MKNLRLQQQILIPFISIILLTAMIISAVSYRFSVNMTVDNLTDNVSELMEQTNRSFERFFRNTEKKLEAIAVAANIDKFRNADTNAEALFKTFSMFHAADANILNIYFGSSQGEMLLYPQGQTLPADFDPRNRPWYELAMRQHDRIVWTEPYTNATDGSLVVTAAKAITVNDREVGVLAIDIAMNDLVQMIKDIKVGDTGYAVLFGNEGTFLYHPDPNLLGKDVTQEEYYVKMEAAGERGTITYHFQGAEKMFSFTTNPTTGWRLAGTLYVDEFKRQASGILWPLLVTTIIVMIAAVLASFLFAGKIVKPINSLMNAMKKVEEGDLSIRSNLERKDEIGQLAKAFNSMVGQMRRMLANTEQISDKVAEAAQTLSQHAGQNRDASSEIVKTMEQIAAGAQHQAELIEQTSQAMLRFSDSMAGIEQRSLSMKAESDSMLDVAQIGKEKVSFLHEQARDTSASMQRIVEAVNVLHERSSNINDIVRTVSDIAEQTSLLALNASIEAARAGESGRGFAVVAEEVRKLAAGSKSALNEISAIIHDMQQQTDQAVALIGEAHKIVGRQEEAVADTEAAFVSILQKVETNTEIIRSIVKHIEDAIAQKDKVLEGMETVTSITQETAAGTEEVSATVGSQNDSLHRLNELAAELDQLSSQLSNELKRFRTS